MCGKPHRQRVTLGSQERITLWVMFPVNIVSCPYWACTGPVLAASDQYRPGTGNYNGMFTGWVINNTALVKINKKQRR